MLIFLAYPHKGGTEIVSDFSSVLSVMCLLHLLIYTEPGRGKREDLIVTLGFVLLSDNYLSFMGAAVD